MSKSSEFNAVSKKRRARGNRLWFLSSSSRIKSLWFRRHFLAKNKIARDNKTEVSFSSSHLSKLLAYLYYWLQLWIVLLVLKKVHVGIQINLQRFIIYLPIWPRYFLIEMRSWKKTLFSIHKPIKIESYNTSKINLILQLNSSIKRNLAF